MSKAGTITTIIIILLLGFWIASAYIPWTKDTWLSKTHFWKNWGKEEEIKPTTTRLYFRARDPITQHFIEANYILKEDGGKVAEGTLMTYAWEEYNADLNKTYILYAWDDNNKGNDYYFSVGICELKEKKSNKCVIDLEMQGNFEIDIAELEEKEGEIDYFVRININNGTAKNPKVCVDWWFNIYSVVFEDQERSGPPSEIEYDYENCYSFMDAKRKFSSKLSETGILKSIDIIYNNCSGTYLNQSLINETIKNIYPDCENIYPDYKELPLLLTEEELLSNIKSFLECDVNVEFDDVIDSLQSLYNNCKLTETSQKDLVMKIKYFDELDGEDYINIYIMDEGDYRRGNSIQEKYFNSEGNDVGIPNLEKTFFYDVETKKFK